MTEYICQTCSNKNKIPHLNVVPSMGHCIACGEYLILYPVKDLRYTESKPPPDDISPWVQVEGRLPEVGEWVSIANQNSALRHTAEIDYDGKWYKPGGEISAPDFWCPIPPLPEVE